MYQVRGNTYLSSVASLVYGGQKKRIIGTLELSFKCKHFLAVCSSLLLCFHNMCLSLSLFVCVCVCVGLLVCVCVCLCVFVSVYKYVFFSVCESEGQILVLSVKRVINGVNANPF